MRQSTTLRTNVKLEKKKSWPKKTGLGRSIAMSILTSNEAVQKSLTQRMLVMYETSTLIPKVECVMQRR